MNIVIRTILFTGTLSVVYQIKPQLHNVFPFCANLLSMKFSPPL